MAFKNVSIAERRDQILNGNVLKTLISLSLPTAFMALVGSFIPMIDGIFLNRTATSEVAGAVSLSGSVINIITALSAGLSVAAMSIIGQLNGQGELQKMKKFASQIMLAGILMGILLMPLTFVGAAILSHGANEALKAPIWSYLSWYTPVIPMLFLASIYNAIKEASGQPEATFFRMVFLLCLKIFFNGCFLYWLDLEEKGAVLASFCSYTIITLWMYYDLYANPKAEFRLSFKEGALTKKDLMPILKLGLPSMANSVLINVGFFLIGLEIIKYGAIVVNAQSIAGNLNALCFTLPSSISSTVTTMISMNIGIGHVRQSKRIYFVSCVLSTLISILMIALVFFFDEALIRLFRNDQEIVQVAKTALNIYTLSTIPFALFSITQGVFIAFGKTKIPLFLGFLRIWLLRYLFILVTNRWLGLHSIFYANLFSNSVSLVILWIWLFFTPWESVLSHEFLDAPTEKKPVLLHPRDK